MSLWETGKTLERSWSWWGGCVLYPFLFQCCVYPSARTHYVQRIDNCCIILYWASAAPFPPSTRYSLWQAAYGCRVEWYQDALVGYNKPCGCAQNYRAMSNIVDTWGRLQETSSSRWSPFASKSPPPWTPARETNGTHFVLYPIGGTNAIS